MKDFFCNLNSLFFKNIPFKYVNTRIIFIIDLSLSTLVSIAIVFALLYLKNDLPFQIGIYTSFGGAFFASCLSIYAIGLYKNVIRYSSSWDYIQIAKVSFVKILVLLLLYLFLIDRNGIWELCIVILLDFIFTTIILFFVRIVVALYYINVVSLRMPKQKHLLVYGINEKSIALVNGRTNVFMFDYHIDGFLVYGENQFRVHKIYGLPIFNVRSEKELNALVNIQNIDGVLYPDISMAKAEESQLVRFCENINLRNLVVPNIQIIDKGIINNNSIRRIKIEDLLGRDEITINLEEAKRQLENKVVLVTGAAGSIGSEICRQLSKLGIKKLICFDIGETAVHNLRLELEENFKTLNFIPIIGDVKNLNSVKYIFDNFHPQVVFHAAAYKHVPLMEENPCEAILTNVYGTKNLADNAAEYGVEKFVMISTDKAVNPTSIMGCSKRIAEVYVQSLNEYLRKKMDCKCKTQYITTRFGNVLGSNGSVVPHFREQIKKGGPVTITHPDIIRFFMTIPEACSLVLEAASIGHGGKILIFDMGDPVKIVDLAKRMIELSGLVVDKDIKIVYIGLRPGEKLYEEVLSSDENTTCTINKKIRIASVREYDFDIVINHVNTLIKLSEDFKMKELIEEMEIFIPEFTPKKTNSI
ncbi:UDP-N-acetylglucosamine 4,6-dehydratase family protein [Bacteroides sp.]|uniref:UDP-N-acetylglucosamine 4,6-dehydratase family protein n=1 Tax=Bacteroides sp. TaxID=29523 RepID=UPI00260D5459|nr:nucleoside-diphosphate sugar epimerase/dehydratase [Bacteroides sp.]